MTIYLVKHEYSTDGGYGDAIWGETTVTAFTKEEDAKAFVEFYADEHVYDTPYDNLTCGVLTIVPMEVETEFTKSYRWHKDKYCCAYLEKMEGEEGDPT